MTQAIKSKFVSKFCGNSYTLDSQYELNFAIYLDMLFEKGEIMGWVKKYHSICVKRSCAI